MARYLETLRQENDALGEHDYREGMGPCLTVEGATTKAVFEAYVQQVLAPSLRPGQVVILENLGAHKGERARELIEGRGSLCSLLFLPPYSSPDFSPIARRPSRRSKRY